MQRLVVLAVVCVALASASLVNDKVDRTLDLTSHLVKETIKVAVSNKGSAAVKEYKLAFDAQPAYTSAAKTSGTNKDLEVKGNTVFVDIPAGGSVDLEINNVYIHAQLPVPAEIDQEETQLVKYTGNIYYLSPYATKTQSTTVKLAGPQQSYSKFKPVKSSNDKIINYGPYEGVEANSSQELAVHFENKTPFLTVTNLIREIEISHWGNVAVTEDISLKHTGATHKGPFSRLDFQRNPQSARAAVRSFDTVLPAAASDIYYRDVIGNVSTSNLRSSDESNVLVVRPRFPLLGGWKTQYTIGYNLPSYEVLSSSGNTYSLKIRFVDHIYDNLVIDNAEIRVILPEGAYDISVNAPFDVSQAQDGRKTYLDTNPRPVVVLRKSNLVEEHMQEFEVVYHFNQVDLLREPLLIIAFFAVLLVSVVFFNRLDLSISKKEAEKKKAE